MRGATGREVDAARHVLISIHAPHAGRDPMRFDFHAMTYLFQSTRPMRGATCNICDFRGALTISIHAPHAGRDLSPIAIFIRHNGISIHAPRMGRDSVRNAQTHPKGQFQSTRPVWGATHGRQCDVLGRVISIHAPRMGRDLWSDMMEALRPPQFQSTRPVWGATSLPPPDSGGWAISIHAPRMGRDKLRRAGQRLALHFNPRAPYGARRTPTQRRHSRNHFNPRAPYGARQQVLFPHGDDGQHFNPRAPYGARPAQLWCLTPPSLISIHAPRMGRDARKSGSVRKSSKFQSTRPVWGATPASRRRRRSLPRISIHAPRMGRDLCALLKAQPQAISIHAPRMGRDF